VAHYKEACDDPRANPDATEKRRICCLSREANLDTLLIQSVAQHRNIDAELMFYLGRIPAASYEFFNLI
jgi:hypothetical protein